MSAGNGKGSSKNNGLGGGAVGLAALAIAAGVASGALISGASQKKRRSGAQNALHAPSSATRANGHLPSGASAAKATANKKSKIAQIKGFCVDNLVSLGATLALMAAVLGFAGLMWWVCVGLQPARPGAEQTLVFPESIDRAAQAARDDIERCVKAGDCLASESNGKAAIDLSLLGAAANRCAEGRCRQSQAADDEWPAVNMDVIIGRNGVVKEQAAMGQGDARRVISLVWTPSISSDGKVGWAGDLKDSSGEKWRRQ